MRQPMPALIELNTAGGSIKRPRKARNWRVGTNEQGNPILWCDADPDLPKKQYSFRFLTDREAGDDAWKFVGTLRHVTVFPKYEDKPDLVTIRHIYRVRRARGSVS